MKVLVLLDHYLPGYRGGGPPRSLSNMVERLSPAIDFWILTRNYDLADPIPYKDVVADEWTTFGKAHVYYCSSKTASFLRIRRLVTEISPEAVYLNSFFSRLTIRYLLLRRIGLLPPAPCVLAPRGEFSPGCLGIKRWKKRLYLPVARRVQLYGGLIWQACSGMEQSDIRRVMGEKTQIRVVPNIATPAVECVRKNAERPEKCSGTLRLVFLSRISAKKNLRDALLFIRNLEGQVHFDIYGPIEETHYWQTCQELISLLPRNVQATYRGMISPADVIGTFAKYHFFLFPTWGENFGHVIVEALTAGCPVIISDQTPWRNLAVEKAGWDLKLDRPEEWTDVLRNCVGMDAPTYRMHAEGARRLAASVASSYQTDERTLALFRNASGRVSS